jgi:predicted Zn finger-like uncharacterized protein
MILTCPSCGTQYVVKDGAIPPGGRQVRCAACKHSWHQDSDNLAGDADNAPPPIGEGEAPSTPPPQPEAVESEPLVESEAQDDESVAEATLIVPRSGPEAEERAYEETMIETVGEPAEAATPEEPTYSPPAEAPRPSAGGIGRVEVPPPDWGEPPGAEAQNDEFSPFPAADEFEPRRRGPVLAILLLVLLVAAVAAAFWFFAPADWKVRLGIVAAGASPLALVTTHMDRQKLESGNELLTVTGRVVNPTTKEQDVPPLQAQLKTRSGQVVYRWTIAPPTRTLPPGASASFNSAEVNVPAGGEELTITLGPPNA